MRKLSGDVCYASDRQQSAELVHHGLLDFLLNTIQLHWRKELAVRKVRQVFLLTTYACKSLNIIIPGLNLLISYRPVDGHTFSGICIEIEITPAIALTAPH